MRQQECEIWSTVAEAVPIQELVTRDLFGTCIILLGRGIEDNWSQVSLEFLHFHYIVLLATSVILAGAICRLRRHKSFVDTSIWGQRRGR